MPRVLVGETPEEARRKARAVPAPVSPAATPTPTPSPVEPEPAVTPTPSPVVPAEEPRGRIRAEQETAPVPPTPEEEYAEAYPFHRPALPVLTAAEREQVLLEKAFWDKRAEKAADERLRSFWATFRTWKPTSVRAAESERDAFANFMEGAGGVALPKGQAEDIHDAYQNVFLATKNMEALIAHFKNDYPEVYTDLEREATGYTVNVATLDPQKSVIDAMNSISEEHPDDYTTFLGTEDGLTELFQRSVVGALAPPGFGEMTLLAPGETGSELIRSALPEGRLTEILANTVEMALDPTFIAMMAIFPPAGLAAKGRMIGELSFGFASGEEIAEETGVVPPWVGGLVGGGLAPIASRWGQGFTRGALKSVLEGAAENPVAGQAATEMLRDRAVVVSGLKEMETALGLKTRPAAPSAIAIEAAVAEKGVTTQDLAVRRIQLLGQEGAETGNAILSARRATAEATLVRAGRGSLKQAEQDLAEANRVFTKRVRPTEDPTTLREMEEIAQGRFYESAGMATAREEAESAREHGLYLMEKAILEAESAVADARYYVSHAAASAKGKPLPPVAGAADPMLTTGQTETMINALIERPEAQDLLRKIAGMMDNVPGAKRLVDITNRMAVVKKPHIRAAVGWMLGKSWQDAQLQVSLATLRQRGTVFRDNAVGQIWLPKEVGQVKPRFGRGPGDWIAGGDVFEDVMRGGKKYLGRLTEEQLSALNEAKLIMDVRTRAAEAATGTKIAVREVHWPRFRQDPVDKRYLVFAGGGGRGVPALHQRSFENMQEAILEHGLRYKPGFVKQVELYAQGMERITRDAIAGKALRAAGVMKPAAITGYEQWTAVSLGRGFPKWVQREGAKAVPRHEVINQKLWTDIQTIIGPPTKNPLITIPNKINSVLRLLLTGSMDTGVGALQMATIAFAFPEAFAESWARGMYTAIVDPNAVYRFMARSPAAQRAGAYALNMGVDSEFFEGTRVIGQAVPQFGRAQPVLDVMTYPARLFIRRMQLGFEAPLLYGRILAFDGMADAASGVRRATMAGIRERRGGLVAPKEPATKLSRVALRAAGGPAPLEGKALHDELFRLARFTDTLLGQPKLGGIVGTRQAQFESAWVWFATRYTRSILGTLSYTAGRGYTPAQARIIMAKMFLGGAATISGIIAGIGKLQGKSKEEIIDQIKVALNPLSGKKYMSIPIGGTWFGQGGAYRSLGMAIAGLADKENWNFDEWGESTQGFAKLPNGLWDNPFFKPILARTSPTTGMLSDFIKGEDFIGHAVDYRTFVDDPMRALWYLGDIAAPITVDAYLQGHGDWQQRLPGAAFEFFGGRSSPETAFEALSVVRDRVSQDLYGVGYDDDKLEFNSVAQQRINDHPDVRAVEEGRVRPIQDKRVQTAWDKYHKQEEAVRGDYSTKKEELDGMVRDGRIDGRTYKRKYGDLQSEEFHELKGIRATLGITFEDKEPPEGSVDFARAAYYDVDLDGKDEDGNFIYYNPETGEYDWEAFYAAREAALAGLSTADREDMEWSFRYHTTELRRDFRTAFDDIIVASGYLDTREVVAESLGLSIDTLKELIVENLQAEGKRAAASDVWYHLDRILNSERKRLGRSSLSDFRKTLRENNVLLDVELFRQGLVSTARTQAAVAEAKALQAEYPGRAYFIPSLAKDASK